MEKNKNKLGEKQKIMLIGLVVVFAIILCIIIRGIVVTKITTNEKGNNNKNNEKYVEVLEDETKVNTSEKIKKENRNVGSYEFSEMKISSKNKQTLITAVVKNIGTTKTPLTAVDIKLLDEKNKEMITLKKSALVAELEPGASTTVTVYCSADFANAYNAELAISE